MNLILIGNNIDDIALDVWKGNTNYTVLNQNPYVWGKDFSDFISNKEVIVSTTSEQFQDKTINKTLEFMLTHKFIPVFIADDKKSIEHNMYTALCEEIPSAVIYTKNENKKDYNELIRIARGYLLGKGIIENDNKTLRTPRKRKKSTSEE